MHGVLSFSCLWCVLLLLELECSDGSYAAHGRASSRDFAFLSLLANVSLAVVTGNETSAPPTTNATSSAADAPGALSKAAIAGAVTVLIVLVVAIGVLLASIRQANGPTGQGHDSLRVQTADSDTLPTLFVPLSSHGVRTAGDSAATTRVVARPVMHAMTRHDAAIEIL